MKLTNLFTLFFLFTASLVFGQVQQPIGAEIYLEANQEILFSEIDVADLSDIMVESDSLIVKVQLELDDLENISKISFKINSIYPTEYTWSQLSEGLIDNSILIDLGVFPYSENYSLEIVIHDLAGKSSVPSTYQSTY